MATPTKDGPTLSQFMRDWATGWYRDNPTESAQLFMEMRRALKRLIKEAK